MLSERSQTQKATCFMTLFMWNVPQRQIQGWKLEQQLPGAKGGQTGLFLRDKNVLNLDWEYSWPWTTQVWTAWVHFIREFFHQEILWMYFLFLMIFLISFFSSLLYCKHSIWLWPVWLSWLSIIPKGERSPVRFPVRAYAWAAGSVPGQSVYERQLIDISFSHWCFSPSLSPTLPISPKINK